MTDKVWDAFCFDIPEHARDNVLTMLSESAHDDSYHEKYVYILERDQLDAINVRVHGILTYNDKEYSYILSDGNWNGTELEDWNGDKEFIPLPRTAWALQPNSGIVSDAISSGTSKKLLILWDAFLNRSDYKDLVRDYTYDRTVQPGTQIENYYRDKCNKVGFVLVSEEEADETRKLLEES